MNRIAKLETAMTQARVDRFQDTAEGFRVCGARNPKPLAKPVVALAVRTKFCPLRGLETMPPDQLSRRSSTSIPCCGFLLLLPLLLLLIIISSSVELLWILLGIVIMMILLTV